MSVRGRHFLSRMLITFDPRGGSSRGMMEYLQKSGLSLKERVENMGGQLFVEVRPSHHPEIRVCYVNGLHLNAVAKAEHKRFLRRTSELHWRSDTTNRLRNRRRNFRMTDKPPFVTRNPDEERREFNRRLIGSDTALGRSRNAAELSAELPPDLPEENYRILSLLTQRGSLKYDPMQMTQYEVKNQERGYRWPAWKVWGPSGKQLIARNLGPKDIANHIWWLTSTTGQRSSRWGNNVERHKPVRPSIQGKWDPTTAARLKHETGKFEIRELAWDEVPKPSSRESSEEELLNAVPFVERAPLGPPTQHPPIPTRAQRRPRGWLGQQQRQQPLPTSKPRASVTDKAAEGSNTNAAAAAAAAAAGAAGMPITPQRGVVDGGSSAGTDTFENSDATDMHAAHALADGQEGMFDDSEAAEAAAAVLVGAEEGEGSVGRGDSDYIAEEAETRDGSDVWGEGQGRGGSSGRHM